MFSDPSQVKNELIANAMCQAVVNGLEICKQLNEIHIVERDRNFASILKNMLAEQVKAAAANIVAQEPSDTTILSSNQPVSVTQSQVKPLGSTGQESPSGRRVRFPCGFATANHVQVFLHKSALSELNVDAIVCFANNKLASVTEVKNPIYDIAGSELQREINHALADRGTIPTSETIVTAAGLLPCKKVIHSVVPKWPTGDDKAKKNDCLKLIRKTFINIIRTANEEDFQSMAMPGSVLGKQIHVALS